jgi:hypothetical protein
VAPLRHVADVYDRTVEFQRADGFAGGNHDDMKDDLGEGLKTGARAALLFDNAHERLLTYRSELETRYGPQPDHGLVFQRLEQKGPQWADDGGPLPWSTDAYKRWTARVWRPAREQAARAPDAAKGSAAMRFYDLRHTAISMALHSTLVMTRHGMNLHNLAAWTGHDVQTLQRRYSHIIARYRGAKPIDLEREFARARATVEQRPFKPAEETPGPQRAAQQRRRARRARAARA